MTVYGSGSGSRRICGSRKPDSSSHCPHSSAENTPPRSLDGPVRRRALARFLDCAPDLVVECIPTCTSTDRPARYFPARRNDLYVLHSATNLSNPIRAGIPSFAQPLNALISIGEVESNPASGNQLEEYIQLTNTSPFAVDMSGWQLAGAVRFTFAAGTVLAASNVVFVSPDVVAFRARATGPRAGQQPGQKSHPNNSASLSAQVSRPYPVRIRDGGWPAELVSRGRRR